MGGEVICDGGNCRRCSDIHCSRRISYNNECQNKITTIRAIKVVECTDRKETYGYLTIEDVSVQDVQREIDEIKNSIEFKNECSDEWCIDDILKRLPSEWKWHYITDDGYTVTI